MARIKFDRKLWQKIASGVCMAIAIVFLSSSTNEISTPYIDPAQFTSLSFGTHSHWLQPWRSYLETVPASKFLSGVGVTFRPKPQQNSEPIVQMLAQSGITQARVEINWGEWDYNDETKLRKSQSKLYRNALIALKKQGIRPLILLNANDGHPCPNKIFQRTVVVDAQVGDTEVELDDISEIQLNYTGVSNLTDNWAAESLITGMTGNTVTLSKPLPNKIDAGTEITLATLKYRPFSIPGSDSYQETLAGWKRYVDSVSNFVTNTLETTDSEDKGFDLEIWNELTFGSNFLYINEYYNGDPYDYDHKSIWTNLVRETANYIESRDRNFQGVKIVDGFSNTIPWGASSTLHPRITALGKHPYPRLSNFPENESKSQPIDALWQQQEKDGAFIPTYTSFFPEHYATALQTETIIRDIAPITSKIYGTEHGRYAREVDGRVIPTPVWITEVNTSPKKFDSDISAQRALEIKAKAAARYYCFYLNKGVEKLYLYSAEGKDTVFGTVRENFQQYAQQTDVYPGDDSIYLSPALKTIGNIVNQMESGIDRSLTETRQLEVLSIKDSHNNYQFAGNGTAAYPNLFNRDVFTFLPFQVSDRKFVVPYYVMTRNIMEDLDPEQFTIDLKGIKSNDVKISAYDPIKDTTVRVGIKNQENNSIQLELAATDYPNLLIIQEVDG